MPDIRRSFSEPIVAAPRRRGALDFLRESRKKMVMRRGFAMDGVCLSQSRSQVVHLASRKYGQSCTAAIRRRCLSCRGVAMALTPWFRVFVAEKNPGREWCASFQTLSSLVMALAHAAQLPAIGRLVVHEMQAWSMEQCVNGANVCGWRCSSSSTAVQFCSSLKLYASQSSACSCIITLLWALAAGVCLYSCRLLITILDSKS